MNVTPRTYLVLVALTSFLTTGNLKAQPTEDPLAGEEFHLTRILAKFRQGESVGPQHPVLRQHGMKVLRQFDFVPQLAVLDLEDEAQARAVRALPPQARARQVLDRVAALKRSGRFEYVEPDYIVRLEAEPTDSAFVNGTLWGLRNTGQNGGAAGADINAVPAWDVTTGSSNVIVAVIDTGIRYTHKDLAANMWANPGEIPGNGLDDDGDGYIDNVYGINAINGSGDPMDDGAHGSHVAGTICAAANDGNPHVGVAWDVRLMACRFIDDGAGVVSDAIECIKFAVGKGARIINASWGLPFCAALRDVIAAAGQNGVLFVAAAGNDGSAAASYPASYPLDNIISVAAHDSTNDLATFSSYGTNNVDLAAPGVKIWSCSSGADTNYGSMNGTSMAAPHVSGVAALVLARFPDSSVGQVRDRILRSVTPVASLQTKVATGGRLNAYGALTIEGSGRLELTISPPTGTVVTAGKDIPVFVRVSDVLSITNATVSGMAGATHLVFADDGVAPDVMVGDGVYSTLLTAPATPGNAVLDIVATAPAKTGASNQVTYAVQFSPPNDDLAQALPLPPGVEFLTYGTNLAATIEPLEPSHANSMSCHSVWWSWTPTNSGRIHFSTSGSSFDTLLAVYTGSQMSDLALVASNDDSGCDCTSASELAFQASAGTEYFIAVAGRDGAARTVTLQAKPSPENDDFANRIHINQTTFFVQTSNAGATRDLRDPIPRGDYALDYKGCRSVWWSWIAPTNGWLSVTAGAPSFSTALAVFSNNLTPLFPTPSLHNLVTLADRGFPFTRIDFVWNRIVYESNYNKTNALKITLRPAAEYQIMFDGRNASAGEYSLSTMLIPAPPNDDFASRIELFGTNTTVGGSTVGATLEPGEPSQAGLHTVWWKWVAPSNGYLSLTATGNGFSPILQVFTNQTLSELGRAAIGTLVGTTNQAGLRVRAGTEYQVRVGAQFSFTCGDLTLTLALPPAIVWTNINGGNWNGAANWEPNCVPGPGDHAVIANSTATVGSSTTVGTLTLCGGTLSGTGTLVVSNVLNWTGGGMEGGGRTVIAPGATLNLANAEEVVLINRTLENGQTVIWTGTGDLRCYTAVLTNRAGALWEVQNDRAFLGEGASRFENAGTFRKSQSPGTSTFYTFPFNNYGTLRLLEGTISFTDSLNFLSSGTVEFSLAGANHPNGYGRISCPSPLALGGCLAVSFQGSYVPSPNQTFTIIEAPILGTFQRYTAPFISSSNYISPLYKLEAVHLVTTETAPYLLQASLNGQGHLVLDIFGIADQDCAVEASTNFVQWISLATNTIPPGGVWRFVDEDVLLEPCRFYRAVFLR
jgi:subtilisin family serine protease